MPAQLDFINLQEVTDCTKSHKDCQKLAFVIDFSYIQSRCLESNPDMIFRKLG